MTVHAVAQDRRPKTGRVAGAPAMIGRSFECGRIGDVLARARRRDSAALLLSGDPGIGKSALCAWAIAAARRERVLTVRGSESEADLPFAGLSELFAGELDRVATLPEPQARALAGGARAA
jgi:predicted ATPase